MLSLATGPAALAEGLRLESSGARYAVGASSSAWDFQQAEIFTDLDLPWHWDLGHDFKLQSRLDISAGWLGNRWANGTVLGFGPLLSLSHEHFPVELVSGTGPTFLVHPDYGAKNFGDPVQFTTYLGFEWNVSDHWRLGYRIQHMSNAGMSEHNPGLNMNMFSLSYRF